MAAVAIRTITGHAVAVRMVAVVNVAAAMVAVMTMMTVGEGNAAERRSR